MRAIGPAFSVDERLDPSSSSRFIARFDAAIGHIHPACWARVRQSRWEEVWRRRQGERRANERALFFRVVSVKSSLAQSEQTAALPFLPFSQSFVAAHRHLAERMDTCSTRPIAAAAMSGHAAVLRRCIGLASPHRRLSPPLAGEFSLLFFSSSPCECSLHCRWPYWRAGWSPVSSTDRHRF